jgi:hypothetical protein
MAENAGFKGDEAAHVAAIAMAESGGDPGAVGSAGEIGLTQINPHAWDFAASAKDPQQAFNDAYQVFQKQGWGAWSTDPSSKNFTPAIRWRGICRRRSPISAAGGNSRSPRSVVRTLRLMRRQKRPRFRPSARRPAVRSRELMAEARPRRAPLVARLPRWRRSNGQRMARRGPGSIPRFRLGHLALQHHLRGPRRRRLSPLLHKALWSLLSQAW